MNKALLLAMLLATTAPSFADEAKPLADEPAIEARLVNLATDLRCLVCQNESLAGSRAELAEDLRREIRTQMRTGKSDQEVIKYLTDRYGDFVLYRPPFKPVTYLLWLAPLIFIGIGAVAWFRVLKRRRNTVQPEVDVIQLAAAAKLLEENK